MSKFYIVTKSEAGVLLDPTTTFNDTLISAVLTTSNATPTTIYSYTPSGAGVACGFQFQVIGTGIGKKSHFIITALATTTVSSSVDLWDVYYVNGPYKDATLMVSVLASNPIEIQVTGVAATNINWRIQGTVMEYAVADGGDLV